VEACYKIILHTQGAKKSVPQWKPEGMEMD
jgi:hypothetical protein